jgi:branched-chain amino acid transport system substrate-binding protein
MRPWTASSRRCEPQGRLPADGNAEFAARVKKVHDLNWHPTFFLTNVSISVGSVMAPAGAENGVSIITWLREGPRIRRQDDRDEQWRAFMAKYARVRPD